MKSQREGLIIENLNPSSVGNAENIDLAKLLKDMGTSLIPDIDVLCLSAVKGDKKGKLFATPAVGE